MESKDSISKPHNKDIVIHTLELDLDDTINEAIKSLFLNKHLSPISLASPWTQDLISKSLTDMKIYASQKRKLENEDSHLPLIPNKKLLRENILEGVVEIQPGIWKSTGSGLIENDEVVEFAFALGFNEGPSKLSQKSKNFSKESVEMYVLI
ncbi:hypothetical protein V6N13_148155 [Hibiscus sabdariffa]